MTPVLRQNGGIPFKNNTVVEVIPDLYFGLIWAHFRFFCVQSNTDEICGLGITEQGKRMGLQHILSLLRIRRIALLAHRRAMLVGRCLATHSRSTAPPMLL